MSAKYTATLTHRIGHGVEQAFYSRKVDAVAFIGRTFNTDDHSLAVVTSPTGVTVWTSEEDMGDFEPTIVTDEDVADVDTGDTEGTVTVEDGKMVVTRSHDPRPGQTVPYTIPQEHDPRLAGDVEAAPPTGNIRTDRIPAGAHTYTCAGACGETKPVTKYPTTRDKSRLTECRDCRDTRRAAA